MTSLPVPTNSSTFVFMDTMLHIWIDRLITGFEHPVIREGYIRVTARMDRTRHNIQPSNCPVWGQKKGLMKTQIKKKESPKQDCCSSTQP